MLESEFDKRDFDLLDVFNRIGSALSICLFFFLIIPWMYKTQEAAKTTATKAQVDKLANEVSTLEQRIIERMKNPEQWKNLPNIQEKTKQH